MTNKRSIGAKLIASVSVLLAVILIDSFSAINTVGHLGHNLDRALRVSTKKADALGNLRSSLSEARAALTGTVLFFSVGDTAQFEAGKQRFYSATSTAERAMTELAALVDDEQSRALVNTLQGSVSAIKEYYRDTLRFCAEQKATEAIELLSKRVSPESDKVERIASRLLEMQAAVAAKESHEAQRNATLSSWLTWIMLGVSLAAGLALVTVVVNGTKELRSLAVGLAEGSQRLHTVASQVSHASQMLAQGATDQAASLEETSASSQEIASMTRKNTESTRSANELVIAADKQIKKANESLARMIYSMREITVSSNKISKILKVIDEIAFQTNILALNAAVEAARAGEAGMGFAVVADEVRNLAQKCAQAAKDTAGLIDESIVKSNEGTVTLDQTAAAIRGVTESALQIKHLVEEVNVSSQEQARGIEQISHAFVQIECVTQRTASGAEESASASEQLSGQAEEMRQVVQRLQDLVGSAHSAAQSSTAPAPPARAHRSEQPGVRPLPARAARGSYDVYPVRDNLQNF